jgi:DNA-binding LacI/PurR family transcriptional regulator
MTMSRDNRDKGEPPITLKAVADHLHLSPGTVSAVVNDSPAAKHIPQHTRNRILAAVRELNYQPNFFARSLRKKRTYTIGLIANEIGDSYGGSVIAGVESYLRQKNYFFLTGIHRHDSRLLETYSKLLMQRGVEGFITVDLNLPHSLPLPTVAVAGHRHLKGVTNIILDHDRAARVALTHLLELGHRRIAFMKGLPASADSADRWKGICAVAAELGLEIDPELVVQIESDVSSPELGYPYAKTLLARSKPFTALFAYNDLSAIGAIRALNEAGLKVPDDVSVVGFDDIESAAFNNPALTTVRQPLRQMGEVAARALLEKIEGNRDGLEEIPIQPELVVRKSTAKAPVELISTPSMQLRDLA